jgi:pimeloyl-ACP methyl ester carboxylesterase
MVDAFTLATAPRSVIVDGVKIRYYIAGPPDGVPIVLLHGFMTSSYSWRGIWESLATRHRVYVIDLPGYGESDWPAAPYSVGSMADAVSRIFQHLKICRAHVFGAQMGATIAAWFAGQYPRQVNTLVLIAPGGLGEGSSNMLLYRLLAQPVLGDVVARMIPRSVFIKRLRAHYANSAQATDTVVNTYWTSFKQRGAIQARIGYQVRQSFEVNPQEYQQVVKAVSAPTLLLFGEDDPIVPISTAERYRESIRGSRLVLLPACGDFPHEEYPETVTKYILAFLDDEE